MEEEEFAEARDGWQSWRDGLLGMNITMKEASKLGSGCILLPKVTIGFGASVSANTIVSNNVKEGAVIGPKSRHFKTYGYRDIDKIRELMNKYQKNE